MGDSDATDATYGYGTGIGEDEVARLEVQGRVLAPATRMIFAEAGIRPGMRVLDLGCGRAMSSIFLRREFGVQVWATDLWFDTSENLQRIRDAGVADGVFPIHARTRGRCGRSRIRCGWRCSRSWCTAAR